MGKAGLRYFSSMFLKGTIAVSLANASTKIIGLILLPIFTYYLSPEEYGLASMVSVVVGFMGLIYNPGLISATTRLYHDTNDEEERQDLFGSAFTFFLFVPLLFTILCLLMGPYVFPKIFSDFPFYPYGVLAILLAFFTQPKRIWVALMTLQYRIHITSLYAVISVVIGSITALILVVGFGMGAIGKILSMFPAALFLFLISYKTVKNYTNGRWSWTSMKKQLVMGSPLIVAIWSYEVFHIADRYMIEKMLGAANVGIYSMGYVVAQIPLFIVMGMRQLWNPIFYENMNKMEYNTISNLIAVYIVFLTFICMPLVLFAKEAIFLLIDVRYYDAIPIIGVIVIGIYFSALLTITNAFLGFDKKFGVTSMIASIAAIANILLNAFLIPVLGIMGAALATLISYFLYLAIGIIVSRVYLNRFSFLPVLLLSACCLVVSYFISIKFDANVLKISDFITKSIILILFVSSFFIFKIIRVSEIIKIFHAKEK